MIMDVHSCLGLVPDYLLVAPTYGTVIDLSPCKAKKRFYVFRLQIEFLFTLVGGHNIGVICCFIPGSFQGER